MKKVLEMLALTKPEFMLLYNNKSYNQIFEMCKNTNIVIMIKEALKEVDDQA